jgi:hypothetical protein
LHLLDRKPNLEIFSIQSNKLFHNFHLSRASGLVQRLLHLLFYNKTSKTGFKCLHFNWSKGIQNDHNNMAFLFISSNVIIDLHFDASCRVFFNQLYGQVGAKIKTKTGTYTVYMKMRSAVIWKIIKFVLYTDQYYLWCCRMFLPVGLNTC